MKQRSSFRHKERLVARSTAMAALRRLADERDLLLGDIEIVYEKETRGGWQVVVEAEATAGVKRRW